MNIVVTGYGVKLPQVHTKEEFLHVLQNGECTQSIIEGMGPRDSSVVLGVINHTFADVADKQTKQYSRSARMALSAAKDAIEMSNISLKDRNVAVIIGTSSGGLLEIDYFSGLMGSGQEKGFSPFAVGYASAHSISAGIMGYYGIEGSAFTLTTGCTASADAIMLAKTLLEAEHVDVCIVGGVDAPICKSYIHAFAKMRLLAFDSSIEEAGVPFSDNSSNFVISEGAGVLVLERDRDATHRKAKILGQVKHMAVNNEGLGINGADPSGRNLIHALKSVTENERVDYINSQALGLSVNDRVELLAHQALERPHIPITSIKGMIGHPLGASTVVQVIASLLSIEYGFIPPTIKTDKKGFETLPIVSETRFQKVESVAVTSHGLGGNNACMLLKRWG